MTAPAYRYPPPYQYPPPYPYPVPSKRTASPVGASLAVIGFAILGVVGSFLPWAQATAVFVGEMTVPGTNSAAGWITVLGSLALGLIGGLSLVPANVLRVVTFSIALILGLVTAMWAVLMLIATASGLSTASDSGVIVSVGPGPVVVLMAGLGAAFAAVFGLVMSGRALGKQRFPTPYWPTYLPL